MYARCPSALRDFLCGLRYYSRAYNIDIFKLLTYSKKKKKFEV